MHLARNCRKFFPTQEWNKEYIWFPEYKTGAKTPFAIEGVECDECPVSFISRESKEFIRKHQRIKRATDMGIQLYAPGTIDARTVDALIVIEREEEGIQHERFATEELERKGSNRNG